MRRLTTELSGRSNALLDLSIDFLHLCANPFDDVFNIRLSSRIHHDQLANAQRTGFRQTVKLVEEQLE